MEKLLKDLVEEIKDSSIEATQKEFGVFTILGYHSSRPFSVYLTTDKQLKYRGIDILKHVYGKNERALLKDLAKTGAVPRYSEVLAEELKSDNSELMEKLGCQELIVFLENGVIEIQRHGVLDLTLSDFGPLRKKKVIGAKIIDKIVEKEAINYIKNYILDNIENLSGDPIELDYCDSEDVERLIGRNAGLLDAYKSQSDINDAISKFNKRKLSLSSDYNLSN